jgi:hypothetical protein
MNIAISRSFVTQYKRTARVSHDARVHIPKARDASAITKTGMRRQLACAGTSGIDATP